MGEHVFHKKDVEVNDEYITKLSKLYIKQRSETRFNYEDIDKSLLFKQHGFSSEKLEKIITRNSVPVDIKREMGENPAILGDIYRSDIGEMLLTSFFEKGLPPEEQFKIPHKNITNRELAKLPGRGMDAIGYREGTEKIAILLGEGKVSQQLKNPPDVVDYTKDSIYETQIKYKTNKQELISKLSDHCRKLSAEDAEKIGVAIMLIECGMEDKYNLVFGCSLIRDLNCVKINEDYGKLFTQKTDFDPHQISFCIFNFSQDIEETITQFYNKVQELCA